MYEKTLTTRPIFPKPKEGFLFFKLLRIKQWIKNFLLFAGAIFARQVLIPMQLGRAVAAFISFCLISSALYIINDLKDIHQDRLHPRKRFRPIASGAVSFQVAVAIAMIFGVAALFISYFLGIQFLLVILTYSFLTLGYTFYFKRVALIDVMIIAAGFVLRAVAGAVAVKVTISPWLLVCTLLLALFLGLTKRRQELQTNNSTETRKVLDSYPVAFLDQAITIVTAATLTGYFLYAFTAHTPWLMVTIPFVLYGIFRYLLLIHSEGQGEEPEQVFLKDKPFLINIVLWLICSGVIIYLG